MNETPIPFEDMTNAQLKELVEDFVVTGRGVKAPTTDVTKVSSPQELMRADLFRKERVIINDNQLSQTKEEMVSISWGNRLLGGQTDFVPMHGEPQYVRRGALANIREATMVEHVQKERGGVEMVRRKRFSVVPVEGLSQEEIDALAAKQAMRNASYA